MKFYLEFLNIFTQRLLEKLQDLGFWYKDCEEIKKGLEKISKPLIIKSSGDRI